MGSYPYEETRHSNSSNFYERFNESDDYEDETPVKKFVNYKQNTPETKDHFSEHKGSGKRFEGKIYKNLSLKKENSEKKSSHSTKIPENFIFSQCKSFGTNKVSEISKSFNKNYQVPNYENRKMLSDEDASFVTQSYDEAYESE